MNNRQFVLPGKVEVLLATLNRLYEQKGESLLREVVVNGSLSIHEEWDYDNWNGGIYGHAITLTVPEDLYFELNESKDQIQNRISADIESLNNMPDEHISAVFVEMEPTDSDHWRENSGVLRRRMPATSIPSDALQRIWGPSRVRVFLSHKSSVKGHVTRLKQSFSRCGIAAFVAHEDIEPTEVWQREIERALFSMDALVALVTKDFHDSAWTDQEVGVAIGRDVPIIAVRLGCDPYGLMGKGQGLGGCSFGDTDSIAAKVFGLLYKRLSEKSRLFECALSVYSASNSFEDSAWKVANLLSRFEKPTSEEASRVVDAYQSNSQNRYSFKGMDLLQPLLVKWTGDEWIVKNDHLVRARSERRHAATTEVPF